MLTLVCFTNVTHYNQKATVNRLRMGRCKLSHYFKYTVQKLQTLKRTVISRGLQLCGSWKQHLTLSGQAVVRKSDRKTSVGHQ